MQLAMQVEPHRFCRLWAMVSCRSGKVLARLGDVLYWVGCILAAIVVVWGAVFAFRGDHADDPYLFSVVAVAAFSIWVIGRALRFILSGK
jgi:hypothetical protein